MEDFTTEGMYKELAQSMIKVLEEQKENLEKDVVRVTEEYKGNKEDLKDLHKEAINTIKAKIKELKKVKTKKEDLEHDDSHSHDHK